MAVVGPRRSDMRLQHGYLAARISSLDTLARLRAAAWDWLELQEEGSEEEMYGGGEGGGGAEDEAAELVEAVVEAVETVASEVRALGRWRVGTDETSRGCCDEFARNLELCARAALVLLLSHPPHELFVAVRDEDSDVTVAHGPALGHGPDDGAACPSPCAAASASRTLRKRLAQWVCDLVAGGGAGEGGDREELSSLLRVQALLEVVNQVGAVPLVFSYYRICSLTTECGVSL